MNECQHVDALKPGTCNDVLRNLASQEQNGWFPFGFSVYSTFLYKLFSNIHVQDPQIMHVSFQPAGKSEPSKCCLFSGRRRKISRSHPIRPSDQSVLVQCSRWSMSRSRSVTKTFHQILFIKYQMQYPCLDC